MRWILLPGTLCTAEVFSPLLNELGVSPSQCHHVTLDAPNVCDYNTRLKSLVKGGEVVCGFSLGALVAAHNLPALSSAKAIVLLAANPLPDRDGNRANRERIRDRVLAGQARDWIAESWGTLSEDPGEKLRRFVAQMAEDTTHLITAQTELAASRPNAAQALQNTNTPLIFVTGSKDKQTPPGLVRPIVENAKSAHLSVLDGLGHFALLEAPERVARVLQGWGLGLDSH